MMNSSRVVNNPYTDSCKSARTSTASFDSSTIVYCSIDMMNSMIPKAYVFAFLTLDERQESLSFKLYSLVLRFSFSECSVSACCISEKILYDAETVSSDYI